MNIFRAKIQLSQNNVKDALESARSAYIKFENLPIVSSQAALKISVTSTLADVYSKLKRTAAEIKLRDQAVAESEQIYKNRTDEHIIAAKYALAKSLEDGDKQKRALSIYAEIYRTLEPLNDDRTMIAANRYAFSLNNVGDYLGALKLRENVADFYRRNNDDKKLVKALQFLQMLLYLIPSKETDEKLLKVNSEIFELQKKFYGEYSSESAGALTDVCEVLRRLNRVVEAQNILKNFAAECTAYLDGVTNIEEKIRLMETLRDIFSWLGQPDNVIFWEESRLQIFRDIVEIKTREPIENYYAAIDAIETLKKNLYLSILDSDAKYTEGISLQRKLIEILEKNSASDEVINAKKELAYILATRKQGYAESFELRKNILEYFQAKYPDDETNEKVLSAMKDLVNLLEYYIGDYKGALFVREEIFRRLKIEGNPVKILDAAKRIASLLTTMEDYVGELDWRERILDFCIENFVEDSPEVIDAMKKLSAIYEEVGEYDNAENLRREIAEMQTDKHGGESSLEVIEAKEIIAQQLQDAGKYDEELAIRQELVELYRNNREENGGDSSFITNALYDVAALFDLLGYGAEAYATRLEIIEEYKKDYDEIVANEILGENSVKAVNKLESIAKALHSVDDYEQELTYRQKIVDFYKAVDENSLDTVNALYSLADVYHETNNELEERKTFQQILAINKRFLESFRANSADDELIIKTLQDIATLEMDLGNVDESNRRENEILSVRRAAVSLNFTKKDFLTTFATVT